MRTSNIVQKSQSDREVGANSVPMSIDEASSVFLMDALGKLYSRPAQAVLREYLSNAVDAHKAKGGTLPPIQIKLPQPSQWGWIEGVQPLLVIRDYGNGMNEEQFYSILSRYGASTKRDSNAMIGGFGLGAKSGFAVSDEFFMTSYQSGRGLRVRIFKDSLNQGYVEVTDRFATTEPDGLLVEVPIPEANLSELANNALGVNNHAFIQKTFSDTVPFFMGYAPDEIDVSPVADYAGQSVHNTESFTPLDLGGKTLGWLGKKDKKNSQVYALIGKVAYKIDTAHLASLARSNKLDKELAAALPILTSFSRMKVIDVPIGSVDMPSAREEITYSERSLKTLSAVLCNYVTILKQYLQQRLNVQKNKHSVLKFIALLEEENYPYISELSWRGEKISKDIFRSSSIFFTEFSANNYYALTEGNFTSLNFSKLLELSNKENFEYGIFRIMADDKADISTLQRLLTKKNIQSVLEANHKSLITSKKALFIITAEDDLINEWLFNSTPLTVAQLQEAALRKQKEHEAQQKRESEILKAKKRAELEQRERLLKEQEAIANATFCHFYLGGNFARLSYTSAEEYLESAEQNAANGTKTKIYYWSEEEIETYATVTKGLKKVSNGVEKTSLLFPFIATSKPNTFNHVVESKNPNNINYLTQLRLFLRIFFGSDASFIIIGKKRSLEEFKTSYPQFESGLLFVKKEIEAQITDQHSRVILAYNALGTGRGKDNTELENLARFVEALDETQKASLNPQTLAIAELFKAVQSTGNISGMADKYLLEVLKAFVTHAEIRQNNDLFESGIQELRTKYPLLVNGSFAKYTPELISHILTYIKLCDSQKFA